MRWQADVWRRKKIVHIPNHELLHSSTNSQPTLKELYQPHYAVHDEKMKSEGLNPKLFEDRLHFYF